MLKIALLDKALFSKKSPPARRLLDALAAAAVGWSEHQNNHDDLYDVVENLIKRIVDEFEDDVLLFEKALLELEEYLSKECGAAEQRIAESTRLLSTREQIIFAKMAVDDALNERLANKDIRAFIRQFILDYWRQLLIITHVEHGTPSEIWRDQLRTVDDLIWSTQDKATPQDRKALSEKLQPLLKSIKRGMVALDMERAICSKFMSMMASVHIVSVKRDQEASLAEKCLLGSPQEDQLLSDEDGSDDDFVKRGLARLFERKGIEPNDLDLDLFAFDDSNETIEEPQNLSPEFMKFVTQVTELNLGDWIEFSSDDRPTIRARFTWISPKTGRYLFTARQGQKVFDTTLTDLADQFARGLASKVDTNPDPIFDRAIGDLMEKLEAGSLRA